MGIDSNWPDYCNVIGCTDPSLRPHHHHMIYRSNVSSDRSISVLHCTCGNVDLPGTKPKEK